MNLPNHILIFGGTGALGTVLTKRILQEYAKNGKFENTVTVFSRDEAKHYQLRNKLGDLAHMLINFVGDVRDKEAISRCFASTKPDLVINCAALKQVPLCEDFISEAVKTNIIGTQNVTAAVRNTLADY